MWDDFCETQAYRDMFRDEYGRCTQQYNYIIREEEYYKKPKELTPEEKFEELKNNIRKKNEIQRKPKKKVSLVTVVNLMILLATLGEIIISKGVIQ